MYWAQRLGYTGGSFITLLGASMNKIIIIALSVSLVLVGCQDKPLDDAAKKLELDTIEKKVSYVMGYDTARKLQAEGFTLDDQVIATAVRDLNSSAKAQMSDEEMQAAMMAFQTQLQEKQQAQYNAQAESNLRRGKAFLKENGEREGVVTTASGLQYEVLVAGSGISPKASDEVSVNYKGSLLTGEVFDSGEGVAFRVEQLIPGWVEALPLMKQGGKWKLFVPSELAYGLGGTGNIGPNSTLVFEMEMLSVGGQDASAKEGEKK